MYFFWYVFWYLFSFIIYKYTVVIPVILLNVLLTQKIHLPEMKSFNAWIFILLVFMLCHVFKVTRNKSGRLKYVSNKKD
jgi:hypothetical protein